MSTMPELCLLSLYYAYYACNMPTILVLSTMSGLWLLCLYYACTMPTMPVLCLFITTANYDVYKQSVLGRKSLQRKYLRVK